MVKGNSSALVGIMAGTINPTILTEELSIPTIYRFRAELTSSMPIFFRGKKKSAHLKEKVLFFALNLSE